MLLFYGESSVRNRRCPATVMDERGVILPLMPKPECPCVLFNLSLICAVQMQAVTMTQNILVRAGITCGGLGAIAYATYDLSQCRLSQDCVAGMISARQAGFAICDAGAAFLSSLLSFAPSLFVEQLT